MMSVQAIWLFGSRSWLAPLILLFLLIAVPFALGIIGAIIERLFGHEASERFAVFWLDAGMWRAEVTLLLAPTALVIYVAFRLWRWCARKKKP